jgi:Protein of unknown function (DUF3108)
MSVRETHAPRHSARPMRQLILLTLAVSLVHALLLGAVPESVHLFSAGPDAATPPSQPLSFVTRMVAAPAVQPSTEPAVESPKKRPVATKPAVPKAAPSNGMGTAAALSPSPGSASAALADTVAAEQPAAPPSPTAEPTPAESKAPNNLAAGTQPPASTTATATAPAPSKTPVPVLQKSGGVARGQKLLVPQPVRLLYDGKGEEKGFAKYRASGELLWLPNGSQYTAQLEITYFLVRLFTWTSKGELTDTGLQPLRFGDKRKGPEKATHFQRDKGIISFSANNPDVPLQPGAQDKLSAILQLSALVAGDPARYSAGTSIRFQATDAHRAEMWNFKVTASESVELPGGTVTAVKLTKEPTVEFDQRIEVWLAPDQAYLPVRLRITEANNAYVDLQWQKTLPPD